MSKKPSQKKNEQQRKDNSGFRLAARRYFPDIEAVYLNSFSSDDVIDRKFVIKACNAFISDYKGRFFRNYYQRSYLYDYVEQRLENPKYKKIDDGMIWDITDIEEEIEQQEFVRIEIADSVASKYSLDSVYEFVGKVLSDVMQQIRKIRNKITSLSVAMGNAIYSTYTLFMRGFKKVGKFFKILIE